MNRAEERFYAYAVGKARFHDRLYFGADGRAAAALGVSRRTIIRHRQSLERQGWLRRCGVRRWPGGKATVCYSFPRRRVTQRTTCRTSRTVPRETKRLSRCKAPGRRWVLTDGQKLVVHFVDECVEQGANDMVKMKGHVARRANELLTIMREHPEAACGQDPVEVVKQALTEFVRRRCRSPMQLAELSVELSRNENKDPAARPDQRRVAKAWIDEHGWPTGARFVHGLHSGSYVYDPLGTEPLPIGYDWPYRRPSFDDVTRALAAS